jgi:NADPH-dependent glutamate synthase beta subunit-like oxidoreductase/NAD(P)H-flavin reductase
LDVNSLNIKDRRVNSMSLRGADERERTLQLGFGLTFRDLHERDGLAKVDRAFLAFLGDVDPTLSSRLVGARQDAKQCDRAAHAALALDLALHFENFIAALFKISSAVSQLQNRHRDLTAVHEVKRTFVQRRAVKSKTAEDATRVDGLAIAAKLAEAFSEPLSEMTFARHLARWLESEKEYGDQLALAAEYALWATLSAAGQQKHSSGTLFKVPRKVDRANLVRLRQVSSGNIRVVQGPEQEQRVRDGFKLTDPGATFEQALDQANYCIWCHNQGKDSCSKGLRDRKTGVYQEDAFGTKLVGCPLEERISEMNLARSRGYTVCALAIVMIDNPLCAATGHRICNDCMKACIYQKQEPVNIPQVETRILKDVLALPWGFEIYSLLSRWNPLNLERPLPRPASGRKVLVAGLGPAGFTLAHHLLNDGHTVVGIDGLKIEPLTAALSGVDALGGRRAFDPIREVSEIYEDLDTRTMAGFGGVAEYGITVRWDKNNLKLIRLLLERRSGFRMYGGIRFGGTLSAEQAFAMGFDHVSLCLGAGKPTVVAMKNGLAKGVRQASDFLMALQLTGAAKADSLANLTVRLPIVVIGGGLTAIDTATEALAYYPLQVEKFLARYERLRSELGDAAIRFDPEELAVANEFVAHARALREERTAAAKEGRKPQITSLLQQWGGATVVYRRELNASPSYTLNHEEVEKAMQEGIAFAECLAPQAVETDLAGHAVALALVKTGEAGTQDKVTLPARTILVAAGTQPNTVLAREDPRHVQLSGKYFQAFDATGNAVSPERVSKPQSAQIFLNAEQTMSFFGDLHPSFSGNVVKAMASATRGYSLITRALQSSPANAVAESELLARLDRAFSTTVHAVHRLTPTIVEVIIKAPAAAHAFHPGQFFRLQNFESLAPVVDGTKQAMEGLALTGAWVDRDRGLVSTIVLEMGGSSDLCRMLRAGDPVVLMGPTGTPTEIAPGETYLFAGGGLGNAVLFSIGHAARSKGCKVLYFAAYKKQRDRFKVDQIEQAADAIVWCCEEAPGFTPGRPQDRAFAGNVVEAMRAYAEGQLGAPTIPLSDATRMVIIGSDAMMAAVGRARSTSLRPFLNPNLRAIASINSPMQCMMKEICGQCLQVHRDPATGEETVVFSCANQDQPLELVDFGSLRARLRQNSVQEKLTGRWIEFITSARDRPVGGSSSDTGPVRQRR